MSTQEKSIVGDPLKTRDLVSAHGSADPDARLARPAGRTRTAELSAAGIDVAYGDLTDPPSLAAGVRRFAHCSTGGVHGHVERPPADEDAPFAPGDAFDTARARRELACDPAGDLPEGIRRTAARYRERGRL